VELTCRSRYLERLRPASRCFSRQPRPLRERHPSLRWSRPDPGRGQPSALFRCRSGYRFESTQAWGPFGAGAGLSVGARSGLKMREPGAQPNREDLRDTRREPKPEVVLFVQLNDLYQIDTSADYTDRRSASAQDKHPCQPPPRSLRARTACDSACRGDFLAPSCLSNEFKASRWSTSSIPWARSGELRQPRVEPEIKRAL